VLAQNHFGEVDCRTAEEDRVAIGRRVRDDLCRQRSAGAWLIVNEDRTEARLDLVGPGPADDVEHPAGRKRQNEPDRPVRVKCCGSRMRAARQRGNAGRDAQKFPARKFHGDSPPYECADFNSPWRLKT
jgi:hypothetical protein